MNNATATATVRATETVNVTIQLDSASVGTAIEVVAGSATTLHWCMKRCRR